MKPTLIGLCGFAQSGKDTVGQILYSHYKFERVAFADALKEMAYASNPEMTLIFDFGREEFRCLQDCVNSMGWDAAKGHPAIRRFVQDLGMAGREIIGPNIWVDTAFKEARKKGKCVAITDVRFPNEWDKIASYKDAVIVRVVRPGVEPPNQHISEFAIADRDPDYVIHNDGTVPDLIRGVREMLCHLAER